MDLGDWLKHCLRQGVQEQGKAAQESIGEYGTLVGELQKEWTSQKELQLSIHAHVFSDLGKCMLDIDLILDAPAHLKKELDTVLVLQVDIDAAEHAIQFAKAEIKKHDVSEMTKEALGSLECTHNCLMAKVDVLYLSLSVTDKFPKLKDIPLEFVRTLLLACDLKVNIRKQVIGSFFEWDKLDQAIGGVQKALGL